MPTIPFKENTGQELPGPRQPANFAWADDASQPEPSLLAALTNEACVKSVQANFMQSLNDLLYHPNTGMLKQQGAAALAAHGPAQDTLGQCYQQGANSLDNDTQRTMFGQATQPLLDTALAQIRQHAQNQCRIFDADASRTNCQSASQLAVNAYTPAGDNTLYRSCAAAAHNNLENLFLHAHGDPADPNNQSLWEHFRQHGPDGTSGMCAIHTGIVNRLIEADQPQQARAYLDYAGQDLPDPTRDKLEQFIGSTNDRQQALNAVLQAQAKSEDHGEQQKALDGMRDNGKINDEAHAIAQHSLQAAQQQQLAVQKQNDEQILGNVWKLKDANPNAAFTDLGAADYAYLKSRGLDQNALAILDGHPASDDPGLFNQLHRLSQEDPVKFAQISLITSSGQLSKAHMDYLQNVQDGINKQDPQAMQASKVVNDAVTTLQAEMNIAGITHNTEPGSLEEKKQAQIESGMRDQLIAAQQAKNGTPLTSDEVQNLAMGYFADQVLRGGALGKGGDEKQTQAQRGREGAPETDGIKPDGGKRENAPAGPKRAPSNGEEGQDTYDLEPRFGEYIPLGKIGTSKTENNETGTSANSGSSSFDKDAAVKNINANAKPKFTGFCAHHVFDAILAGLPEDQKKLFERKNYAKDAGPSLEKVGFKKVLTSSDQLDKYTPQKGDVVVLQDYPQQGHYIDLKDKDGKLVLGENRKPKQVWKDVPAGHIAIFNGEYWVSDKVQSGDSGIWAGPGFKNANVGMVIYRH